MTAAPKDQAHCVHARLQFKEGGREIMCVDCHKKYMAVHQDVYLLDFGYHNWQIGDGEERKK